MARLYVLFFIAQIVLAVVALIGCLSAEEGEIRALPRIAWVLIILFFPLVGSIAWFVAGRPVTSNRQSGGWRVGGGFPERERPRRVAPDDDPEFLRSLGEKQADKERELFENWEADLRRREGELRRRDTGAHAGSGDDVRTGNAPAAGSAPEPGSAPAPGASADPGNGAAGNERTEAGEPPREGKPREENRPEA